MYITDLYHNSFECYRIGSIRLLRLQLPKIRVDSSQCHYHRYLQTTIIVTILVYLTATTRQQCIFQLPAYNMHRLGSFCRQISPAGRSSNNCSMSAISGANISSFIISIQITDLRSFLSCRQPYSKSFNSSYSFTHGEYGYLHTEWW